MERTVEPFDRALGLCVAGFMTFAQVVMAASRVLPATRPALTTRLNLLP